MIPGSDTQKYVTVKSISLKQAEAGEGMFLLFHQLLTLFVQSAVPQLLLGKLELTCRIL